jgi:high-affinity nickel-transport protein
MWLILVFPVLFTVGMCLVDTIDGALMMSLYVAPMGMGGDDKKEGQAQRDFDQAIMASSAHPHEQEPNFGPGGHGRVLLDDDDDDVERAAPTATATAPSQAQDQHHQQQQQRQKNDHTPRVKDPLTFLYYSIVLTTLTVICAIIIGIIQLLTMILNVATPKGRFWDGVEVAGDNYEIIGGSICASFIVFGGISVLCYKPWRRWVDRKRDRLRGVGSGGGGCGYGANASSHGSRETSSSIPAWAAAAHERERERERDLNILEEQEDLVSVSPGPDHGEAEELVEVRGKTSTQRVGVKAFEADDNLTIPGASGGTR